MVYLDCAAWFLAVDAIVTAWFYGSIFTKIREAIEDRGGLLGELAGCPLCLTYHISFWVGVLLWAPVQLDIGMFEIIPRLIMYSLAATTLVHWLQGERPIPVEKTDE